MSTSPTPTPIAEKDLINAMVSRFLCWKLPADFAPDCGISFVKVNHPTSWPTGTNLLDANQAKAMFTHVLGFAKLQITSEILSTISLIDFGQPTQAFKPITADMVTDEMVFAYTSATNHERISFHDEIAAAVNAYHKADRK